MAADATQGKKLVWQSNDVTDRSTAVLTSAEHDFFVREADLVVNQDGDILKVRHREMDFDTLVYVLPVGMRTLHDPIPADAPYPHAFCRKGSARATVSTR